MLPKARQKERAANLHKAGTGLSLRKGGISAGMQSSELWCRVLRARMNIKLHEMVRQGRGKGARVPYLKLIENLCILACLRLLVQEAKTGGVPKCTFYIKQTNLTVVYKCTHTPFLICICYLYNLN